MLPPELEQRLERAIEIRQQMQDLEQELQEMFGAPNMKRPEKALQRKKSIRLQGGLGRRRGDPCPECGSKGTRHFKTCSLTGFHVKEDPPKAKPLSLEQFSKVREAMHDKDFQSARFALTNKMSPAEVNKAVRSASFEEYRTMGEV